VDELVPVVLGIVLGNCCRRITHAFPNPEDGRPADPGQEVDQDADLETKLRQIVAFDGAAWNGQRSAAENHDRFRPLRAAPGATRKAA
jgi:hypothetical protein